MNIPVVDVVLLITKEKLVFDVIEWLSANIQNTEDFYEFKTSEEKSSWLKRFKDFLSNPSPSYGTGLAILNDFSEHFLNNPYSYEYDSSPANHLIMAKRLGNYFVRCMDVPVPVRILIDKYNVNENQFLTGFIKGQNDAFTRNAKLVLNGCSKIIGKGKEKCRFFAIIFALLLCGFAGVFGYRYLISAVRWDLLSSATKSGADFFQIVGYLTKDAFGLNLNCSFSLWLILFALLWLVGGFFLCIKLIKEMKVFFLGAKKNAIIKKLAEALPVLDSISNDQGRHDRNVDIEKCKDVLVHSHFLKKDFSMSSVLKLQNQYEKLPINIRHGKLLPGSGKLFFLIVLMILTLWVANLAKSETFIGRYNMVTRSVSHFLDSQKLRVNTLYYVKEPTPIFSGMSQECFETYVLNPNKPLEIINKVEKISGAYHVKFDTEFGMMTGWIHNGALLYYDPTYSEQITKMTPDTAKASSTASGDVNNLCNDKSYRGWGEGVNGDGIGEFVEFTYSEPVSAKYLLFQIGNTTSQQSFVNYSRPIEFMVDFYNQGTLAARIPITLDDVRDKQYIRLNKTIDADKVHFEIKNIIGGTKYNQTYISCLGVYKNNPETK